MNGNGCVSECLHNVILVRRLWTGRGQLNESVMFGELRVFLFVCLF